MKTSCITAGSIVAATLLSSCSSLSKRDIETRRVYDPYPAAYTIAQNIAYYLLKNGEKISLEDSIGYQKNIEGLYLVTYVSMGTPQNYFDDAINYGQLDASFWCIDDSLDDIPDSFVITGKSIAIPFENLDKRSARKGEKYCKALSVLVREYINNEKQTNEYYARR